MPPACAMAIAICASVTVSIAEAMIGMFTEIDVGWQNFRQARLDQYIVESESFARACIIFSGHRQLRLAQKGSQTGRQGLKMPVARGVPRLRHGPLLGWRGSIARDGADS